MTSRTISVPEEVYLLLEKMRLPGEKVSDTILRLFGIKARAKDFEKALDEVVSEDAELLEKLAK